MGFIPTMTSTLGIARDCRVTRQSMFGTRHGWIGKLQAITKNSMFIASSPNISLSREGEPQRSLELGVYN